MIKIVRYVWLINLIKVLYELVMVVDVLSFSVVVLIKMIVRIVFWNWVLFIRCVIFFFWVIGFFVG